MQEFLISGAIGGVLITLTCLIVYEALRIVWGLLPRLTIPHRMRILVVISAVFLVHIINIWMYAIAYYLLINELGFGALSHSVSISDATHPSFWDLLYFSSVTYSTVGFGDLLPTGGLRMIAGAEGINGIIAIGWTVSFTYLAMERFWSMSGTKHS